MNLTIVISDKEANVVVDEVILRELLFLLFDKPGINAHVISPTDIIPDNTDVVVNGCYPLIGLDSLQRLAESGNRLTVNEMIVADGGP